MSSESERRLSTEEPKRLNQSGKTAPPTDGAAARGGLERTAGSAGGSGGQRCGIGGPAAGAVPAGGAVCPTQAQMEALVRDVAQIREALQQAGKKRGLSISPPSLRTALSVSIWLVLILLATMVGMVVLQTIWSGLAALWSAVRTLIP